MTNKKQQPGREYDFALILGGVDDLTESVMHALFEAGCDDATLSMRHGVICAAFSRRAASLAEAILSAIRDVRKADIDAEVLRVDACDLVTPAEIARRIGRTRQLVAQYINGKRGPGGFPPPEYRLVGGPALWSWCAVSHWLSESGFVPEEESRDAETVAVISALLDEKRFRKRNPRLFRTITAGLAIS